MAKKMSFNGGKAMFLSRAARQRTWPCGVPHNAFFDNKLVRKFANPAQFERNRYETTQPEMAAGLIQDDRNFGRSWGWSLDTACIPREIAEFWSAFSREKRQEIGLRLAAGEAPELIFESLSDDDREQAARQRVADERPLEFICPVSRCGAKVEGAKDVNEARQALMEHVRIAHPDWDGGTA